MSGTSLPTIEAGTLIPVSFVPANTYVLGFTVPSGGGAVLIAIPPTLLGTTTFVAAAGTTSSNGTTQTSSSLGAALFGFADGSTVVFADGSVF